MGRHGSNRTHHITRGFRQFVKGLFNIIRYVTQFFDQVGERFIHLVLVWGLCSSRIIAGFVRRAGLRIIFFGIVHCIGFLLVIAFPSPWGAGRFFKAVKSFHWRGRLRAEPGMRRLPCLQLGIVLDHYKPVNPSPKCAKSRCAKTFSDKLQNLFHDAWKWAAKYSSRLFFWIRIKGRLLLFLAPLRKSSTAVLIGIPFSSASFMSRNSVVREIP